MAKYCHILSMCQYIAGSLQVQFGHFQHETAAWYGYGSIPINTIFSGMNIHLPAILMFTRGTRFWHTAIFLEDKDDQDGLLEQKRHPFISIRWILPMFRQFSNNSFHSLPSGSFISVSASTGFVEDVFSVGNPTFEEITLWWTNIAMENHHF